MLDELQRAFLRYFLETGLSRQFYVTGGTALAEVYLHHRRSFDLDFFTPEPFDYEEIIRLMGAFARANSLKEPQFEKKYDRRMFFLTNGVQLKVEFVRFEHPQLEARTVWPGFGIAVDSLRDMTANKTLALIDRQEPKDAVDLYYIMRRLDLSLDDVLELLKNKFGVMYQRFSLAADFASASQGLHALTPHLTAADPRAETQIIISYFKELAERENPFRAA